jgi:hypothetical protein
MEGQAENKVQQFTFALIAKQDKSLKYITLDAVHQIQILKSLTARKLISIKKSVQFTDESLVMEQLVVGQKRLEAAVRVLSSKIFALELHGHMIRCRAPPCYPFFVASPRLHVSCHKAPTPCSERVSPATERAHP